MPSISSRLSLEGHLPAAPSSLGTRKLVPNSHIHILSEFLNACTNKTKQTFLGFPYFQENIACYPPYSSLASFAEHSWKCISIRTYKVSLVFGIHLCKYIDLIIQLCTDLFNYWMPLLWFKNPGQNYTNFSLPCIQSPSPTLVTDVFSFFNILLECLHACTYKIKNRNYTL